MEAQHQARCESLGFDESVKKRLVAGRNQVES